MVGRWRWHARIVGAWRTGLACHKGFVSHRIARFVNGAPPRRCCQGNDDRRWLRAP